MLHPLTLIESLAYEEQVPWPVAGNNTMPLYNLCAGKRCFVIGNGPSLNLHDLSLLNNDITIGCNGIFYKTVETGFIPTFYTVEDPEFAKANVDAINNYDAPLKILPSTYINLLKNSNRTFWYRENLGYYMLESSHYCHPRFTKNFADRAYGGQTVTYINIQLAFWLGCTEVYLIGMDHEYKIPDDAVINGLCICSQHDDTNHFHHEYFKGKVWHDPKLENVERSFAFARIVYEAANRRLINASMGGKLEIFEREDFLAVVAKEHN